MLYLTNNDNESNINTKFSYRFVIDVVLLLFLCKMTKIDIDNKKYIFIYLRNYF